jgi:hypothetical protein
LETGFPTGGMPCACGLCPRLLIYEFETHFHFDLNPRRRRERERPIKLYNNLEEMGGM